MQALHEKIMRVILILVLIFVVGLLQAAIRHENITDLEVSQLESAVASFSNGQINYIGVVNDYCHCMDGPDCKATVDVTVKSSSHTKLYELSQIKDTWQVGPRLQFKFDWADLKQKIKKATYDNNDVLLAKLMKEREQLAFRARELRKSCNKFSLHRPAKNAGLDLAALGRS